MFASGFVSSPKPFEARFEVRSDKHRRVIEDEWETVDKDLETILDGMRQKQVEVGLSARA